MNIGFTLVLAIAATAVDGILAGASLDQSIKQLPARHKMGVLNFSVYSRASDLGNGILWYAILGIGAAALTIAAGVAAYVEDVPRGKAIPIFISTILAVLHSAVTTQAAPIDFSQREAVNDEKALAEIFDKFEKWQTVRCMLQVLTFAAMLWALASFVTSSADLSFVTGKVLTLLGGGETTAG